jgi:hypothetical protein
MPSAKKLQVKWPPVSSSVTRTTPRPLSSEEETSDGQEITKLRGAIKDKIHMYESMAHKSRDVSFLGCGGGDGDCLTMKLRRTHLDDSNQSTDDSSEVPAGQILPQPTGCRRISYRIRYETPTKIPRRDRFGAESAPELQQEGSTISGGKRMCGRGIHGFNRPNSSMTCSDDSNIGVQHSSQLSSRHRRSSNPEIRTSNDWTTTDSTDETNDDDDDHDGHDVDDDEDDDDDQEVDRSRGCHEYERPDLWITPIESKDGSRKWIAKRVWDIEDIDNEEPEYEVDHPRLMDGIRDLLCVPEDLGKGIIGCRGYNRPDGVQDMLCEPEDLGETAQRIISRGIRGCHGYNRPDGVRDILCEPEDLGETTQRSISGGIRGCHGYNRPDGVRDILCEPSGKTTNEWQVNISPPLAIPGTLFSVDDNESYLRATAAHRDSPPVPLRQNQFIVEKFIDIDGNLEGSGATLSMDGGNFDATKLEHITDVTSHEKQTNLDNCSVVSDSYTSVMESSFTSIDDLASPISVSVSVPSQSVENDQHVSEDDAHSKDSGDDVPNRKRLNKNERWLSTYRPDDDEAESALAQQSAKCFSDYRPKWRKPLHITSDDPDYCNVPYSAADEDELPSSDGSSLGGSAHNQRGFGRPDSWLMKENGRNEVSDPRSWRSNTSNTTIDDGGDDDKDVCQENETKRDYDSEPNHLVDGEEQSESVSWRSNTSIDDGDDDDKDVYQENETKRDYDPEPSLLVDGEEQSESVYQSKHNRNINETKDPEVKGNKDEERKKKNDKEKSKKKNKAKKEKKKKKAEDDTKKKKAKKEKKKKADDDTPAVPKDNEYDSSEDGRFGSPAWKKRAEPISNVKLWWPSKKKKAEEEKKKKKAEDDTTAVSKDNEYDSSEDERYGSPTWKKRAKPVNVKEPNVKLWWQCD